MHEYPVVTVVSLTHALGPCQCCSEAIIFTPYAYGLGAWCSKMAGHYSAVLVGCPDNFGKFKLTRELRNTKENGGYRFFCSIQYVDQQVTVVKFFENRVIGRTTINFANAERTLEGILTLEGQDFLTKRASRLMNLT